MQSKNSTQCKSILIVDDDDSIRQTLRLALEYEGYHVSTAENGRDAISKLDVAPYPSLILLDLMMPVLSGWQLRERMLLDARLRHVPVIVMSATADGSTILQAEAVMRKPVDFEALTKLVKKFCS